MTLIPLPGQSMGSAQVGVQLGPQLLVGLGGRESDRPGHLLTGHWRTSRAWRELVNPWKESSRNWQSWKH